MSDGLLAYTIVGVFYLLVGGTALALVICSGRHSRAEEARAAGVVTGAHDDLGVLVEEQEAEAAYLAELYAASPDVDWRDCPVVPGRDGSNP